MSKEQPVLKSIERLPDGTVKQTNMLSGTEVWTVPGRGHRPLTVPGTITSPIEPADHGKYCAFCEERYLETPPEKARLVKREDGSWEKLSNLRAEELFDTVAEFRRVPNLFEIVSYKYWHLNHGHKPSEDEYRRMADYLASSTGYDHVMRVVKARLMASGKTLEELAELDDSQLLPEASGFFSGGHDIIIARNHYEPGAEHTGQLASSGTLTPEEHYQYMKLTADAMKDLYSLNENVAYVACFQNWLKPAGASFDHLHKQLVAIDEHSVQTEAELQRLRRDPNIYKKILHTAITRGLLLAQNEHAVAIAGIGHRYPSIAIWPLGKSQNPWEVSDEKMRGVSDLTHAIHAATGAEVPANEEWYHRPPDIASPMRWRLLIKWRISTLAGFEGGTRIYLNTIDPWGVRDRLLPKLKELREQGKIADMLLGDECKL
ncbi:MAG: DUF4921 family protein, partial [Actinomycetaceae bacterium]|nr:DUF4921 family protein [Actinomycetaceae bacterium]